MYLDKSTPEFERKIPTQPAVCTMEMTIYEILHKLVTKQVHRLFVVDSEQNPIGVLSLCDIIDIMNTGHVDTAQ